MSFTGDLSSNRWRSTTDTNEWITYHPLSTDSVTKANRLYSDGFSEAALDLIYDDIDQLLRHHRFAECDYVLCCTDVASCSVDILLALLTATLPAKAKLSTRAAFLQHVEQSLRSRNENPDELLEGLA